MSTILCVKRCVNDKSFSALLLNFKRRKLENLVHSNIGDSNETTDEISIIFEFIGTEEYKDESIVSRITKDHTKIIDKKRSNQRIEIEQNVKYQENENNFNIVKCYHVIKDLNNKNNDQKEITVIDVEMTSNSQLNENKLDTSSSSTNFINSGNKLLPYVYDFYLSKNDEQMPFEHIDNYNVSIKLIDDLIFEDLLQENNENPNNFDNINNCNRSNEIIDELVYENTWGTPEKLDSDDSNCENYYKNDYPDSEDNLYGNSLDDEDIKKSLECSNIDNENNLSNEDLDHNVGVLLGLK
ncbi:probable serine/threonine-protein kinase clkA [Condylostylus longicornis]|uniref:probable serine/threonine-protein kinase clkA n=1 Tax=Condylostylus longicornis TaxID=2530218 RepID=UPI00244E3AA4|nr:probable serine/threonine-protein kinase clkA [Condylostylus longicornis]